MPALHRVILTTLKAYFGLIAILLALLPIVSWIASIYHSDINGLLSPAGIRWMFSSVVDNFADVPLAHILTGLVTLSILHTSGVLSAFTRRPSLKQRRAALITLTAAVALLILFSLLLILPHAVLLSAFGTISHSALAHGWYGLLALYLIVISNIYAYTSGRLYTLADFLQAHTSLIRSISPYFILLFLSSQLVACLDYTALLTFFGMPSHVQALLTYILYYLPLVLYLSVSHKQHNQ